MVNYKVNYEKKATSSLEKVSNVYLDEVTAYDRKDIVSLVFLPIDADSSVDVTEEIKYFPVLEKIYLPSNLSISFTSVTSQCPKLKQIIKLTKNQLSSMLDKCVVTVVGSSDGGNNVKFISAVENTKDGKQYFSIHPSQIQKVENVISNSFIERLTLTDVDAFANGENGLLTIIDKVNEEISAKQVKIEVSKEMVVSILTMLVEKGVTKNEFTIDFSKLCDKIESYKGIVENVTEESINEEVETDIVTTIQNVLKNHFENALEKTSKIVESLCLASDESTENMLLADLNKYVVDCVICSPDFDEEYEEDSSSLTKILDKLPNQISSYVKSTKSKQVVKVLLQKLVDINKEDMPSFVNFVTSKLDTLTDLDSAKSQFEKAIVKNNKGTTDVYLNALIEKDLSTLTKDDLKGIINNIKEEMKDGDYSGENLKSLITETVRTYPTTEEIRKVLNDFIVKHGYATMKNILA